MFISKAQTTHVPLWLLPRKIRRRSGIEHAPKMFSHCPNKWQWTIKLATVDYRLQTANIKLHRVQTVTDRTDFLTLSSVRGLGCLCKPWRCESGPQSLPCSQCWNFGSCGSHIQGAQSWCHRRVRLSIWKRQTGLTPWWEWWQWSPLYLRCSVQ